MKQSLCCRPKPKYKWTICARLASTVDPRLLGAYAERGWWWVGVCVGVCGWDERMDATHLSVFHSVSNRARGKCSSLSQLPTLWLFFFLSKRLNDIHVTWFDWFYVERVTAHRIKMNDYSCFHNLWPNSKTKLKWKYLWEQGAPWCFGGPT